ncbi:hypothetical protein BD626DRAFT_477882 [Schizophyllum amplum]|uniref:Uncharacterized protein n=1 Tax=Schizophyllum amplum TaxID=97359 RepID=A0A550D0K9_9AGAR|nr:hypothetical protein BD626DRAFT_477882 [Auriculariopsis ampla]
MMHAGSTQGCGATPSTLSIPLWPPKYSQSFFQQRRGWEMWHQLHSCHKQRPSVPNAGPKVGNVGDEADDVRRQRREKRLESLSPRNPDPTTQGIVRFHHSYHAASQSYLVGHGLWSSDPSRRTISLPCSAPARYAPTPTFLSHHHHGTPCCPGCSRSPRARRRH